MPMTPGIPADFVALSPNGILDPHDLIYWGPKDVLKAYFKDPSSLKVPLIHMMECAMGAKWKQGEPMVKIYGEIVVNNKNLKSTTNYVTSIFFKTVQDFSFKKDDVKKSLIFQKICEKTD